LVEQLINDTVMLLSWDMYLHEAHVYYNTWLQVS